MKSLLDDLRNLLNSYSAENASNTPDFVLAQYLLECLHAYNRAVIARGEQGRPGSQSEITAPATDAPAHPKPEP